MSYVLTGIGLLLLIEGLVYALAPSLIEDLLAAMRQMSLNERRIIGFIAMLGGLVLLSIAHALGASF